MINRKHVEMSKRFIEYPHGIDGIVIFIDFQMTNAVCFTGRRQKRDWYYHFDDNFRMIEFVEQNLVSHYKSMERKRLHRKTSKEEAVLYRKNVKVGDIFYTSWGYNSTHVDFFQVVGRPTPAGVIIRQIDKTQVTGDWMSGNVRPVPDSFISEEKKCRLDNFGNICSADRYGHKARKTNRLTTHYVSCD